MVRKDNENRCPKRVLASSNELLTRKEVAKYFKVTKTTIYLWGKRRILNPLRCGNRVYYDKQEVINTPKPINNIKPL
jgi:hypothetical protein